ncbi:MAG: ribonuclease HI [Clostridia bacterium]|nr:ribonuclease HI [Clostridia bacterium]
MSNELKHVEIFADGACSGNPGPGGWGTILRCNGKEKELSGGARDTTNNRMEITAVLEGLRALKFACKVTVTTDSQYVYNSITKGWAESWRKNGWIKKDKKPALNADLWEELLNEIAKHKVTFVWIKGHNGHSENERCDALAVAQSEKYKTFKG